MSGPQSDPDQALEDLRRRVQAARDTYDAVFAGQPRISRDLETLAGMRASLAAAVASLEATPGGASRDTLLERARKDLALYAQEHAAVEQAQAQGPDALSAHDLSTWVGFVSARYRRHFAGHPRASRDLGLLAELVDTLRRLDGEARELAARFENAELRDARTAIADSLSLYLTERGEIVDARASGDADQQGDLLATLANEQFRLYQAHFAGKSRLSRRPELVQRIVDNLEQVRDRMQGLRDQGHASAQNDRNIEIVAGRVAFYRTELEEIRKARAAVRFQELVGALGTAANGVFDEYRAHFAGQDRRTRDLQRLGDMCDALWDLLRQMDDLDRVREDERNLHNRAVVTDTLRLYEREWDEVKKAQAAPAVG